MSDQTRREPERNHQHVTIERALSEVYPQIVATEMDGVAREEANGHFAVPRQPRSSEIGFSQRVTVLLKAETDTPTIRIDLCGGDFLDYLAVCWPLCPLGKRLIRCPQKQ